MKEIAEKLNSKLALELENTFQLEQLDRELEGELNVALNMELYIELDNELDELDWELQCNWKMN